METVINALKTLRIGKISEEYDLQQKIASTFSASGIAYEKEYQLGAGSRVDFLVDGCVAVEVKKGKPNRTQLYKQINKYAEYPEVKSVVIVVETSLRSPINETDNGKPCIVLGLQKLWGIAL